MTPNAPIPDQPLRPRRRFSLWTILAPAALILLVVLVFNAVGKSCAFKDCDAKKSSAASKKESGAAKKSTAAKQQKQRRGYKVRSGDSLQTIAARFELSEADLKACNPKIFDFRTIQVGQYMLVDRKRCSGAAEREAKKGGGPGADPTATDPEA